MDSHSTQLRPCRSSAAPAATANPQCMLLAPYGGGINKGCDITGDTKTIAAGITSNGHRISVSLRREPAPALSRICLRFLPGRANRQSAYSTVIAAHGGSLLLQITSTEGYLKRYAFNYFVYNNAVAADPARPPSLYLLPVPPRQLDISATGLLCHSEAEFVVAELKVVGSKSKDGAGAAAAASPIAFELYLFRHGEWCVKRPRIIGDDDGKDADLLLGSYWGPQAVVALGDGILCWVDRYLYRGLCGVIFSDVLDENPELRYVPYPAEALSYRRFLCTNARGALKLVSLSPRRCSHCGCSDCKHSTAVNTWALKTEDRAWVLETETIMVDSAELWALETNVGVGYARVHLVPCASMNGGGHHVVLDESAAPTEEEDEHMASHKGIMCTRAVEHTARTT